MDLKFVTLETFVIQFIILLFVLWVLNKFLFKPYLSYLDSWEEKQTKLEKDYKNIDKLISQAKKDWETILGDARKKADLLIADAENLAKSKRESILLKAKWESESMIEGAKADIEKEKLSMLEWVKSKLVDIVLKFNRKLFSEEKLNKDFLEKSLANIK